MYRCHSRPFLLGGADEVINQQQLLVLLVGVVKVGSGGAHDRIGDYCGSLSVDGRHQREFRKLNCSTM